MNKLKTISTILIFLVFKASFAHQDFWVFEDYGKVKVRIETGYEYEEIEKVKMIGKLANHLCDQLGYKKRVFLDFDHYYTGNCDSDYFISFDKGQIKDAWNDYLPDESPIGKDCIVIRQISRNFSPERTLLLLEYAIQNEEFIKMNQDEIHYEKNYCQWKINTIDTVLINSIIQNPPSENILKVSNMRIARPKKKKKEPLSYYLLNNNYVLIKSSFLKNDVELVSVSNIYDIAYFNDTVAVIFEDYNSFYYVDIPRNTVSKKIIISDAGRYYWPFRIQSMDANTIEIYYSYYGESRTLVYDYKTEHLTQRINKE